MTGSVFAALVQQGAVLGLPALGTAELVELYRHPVPDPARPWLRTNFVTTLDGAVAGSDGRSGSINTASDHYLFALMRAAADGILVGAGTARAEGYRAVDLQPWQRELRLSEGLSPVPTLVLISRSLSLPPNLVDPADPDAAVLVVTTRSAPSERVEQLRVAGIAVEQVGDVHVDLIAAVELLAGSGRPRLLCEGGPTLLGTLLSAGLVDEMCLSLAPSVIGGPGGRSSGGADLGADLSFRLEHLLLADDGTLFSRYVRER